MARSVARQSRAAAAAPPGWIRPQLTELVDAAPDGPAWLHEIKFDGYRMHARLDEGELADWRAGRNAVYQLAALTVAARLAVADALSRA